MKHRAIYFFPTVAVLIVLSIVGLSGWRRAHTLVAERSAALIAQASAEWGVAIRYDLLSFHSINAVQLDGVAVDWRGHVISAQRITIRVNPFRLRADQPLAFVRSVVADRVRAELDAPALREFAAADGDTVAGGVTQSDRAFVLSRVLNQFDGIRVALNDSVLILTDGPTRYAAEHINVSAVLADRQLTYRGACSVRRYQDPDRLDPLFVQEPDSQIRLAIVGDYQVDSRSSESRIRLHDIHIAGFNLHPFLLRAQYRADTLSIVNDPVLRDLHVQADFDISNRTAALRVSSAGIRYDQFVLAQRSTAAIPALFRGEYVFAFDASYDLPAGALAYQLQFDILQQRAALLRLRARGDEEMLHIDEALLAAPATAGSAHLVGAIDFTDQTMSGSLFFDRFAIADSAPINGTFDITATADGVTAVTGQNLTIGAVSIPRIATYVQLAPSVRTLNVTVTFDQEQTQIASLIISDNHSTAMVDITLSLLRVPMRRAADAAAALFAPGGTGAGLNALNDLYVDTRLELETAADRFRLDAPVFNIVRRSTATPLLTLRASGNQDAVTISPITVNTAADELRGFAAVHTVTDQIYDITLTLRNSSRTYAVNARYRQDHFIRFTGSYGLSGVVLFLPQRQLRYDMQLAAFPFQLADSEFVLQLTADGDFRATDDWQVNVPRLNIVEAESTRVTRSRLFDQDVSPYRLDAALTATPQLISIDRLTFEDHVSLFTGAGELAIRPADIDVTFELTSAQLAERIAVTGSVPLTDAQSLSLVTTLDRINLQHAPQTALYGSLNATMIVAAGVDGLVSDLTFASADARFGTLPIAFQGAGVFAADVAVIDDFDVDFSGYQINDGFFRYDRTNHTISSLLAVVQYERRSLIPPSAVGNNDPVVDSPYPLIQSRIVLDGVLADGPDAAARLQTAQIQVIPEDDFATTPLRIDVNYEQDRNRHAVISDDGALSGYVNGDRSFSLLATREFPVSFALRGSVNAGSIDMVIADIFVDAENIPRLADLGFLRFTAGRCTGSLYITGAIGNPQFYGRIGSDQLRFLLTYVPGEIGPVNTFLIFQGRELRLVEAYVPVGENQGAYFASVFLIRGNVLDYVVDIRTPSDTLAPFRYDFGVVDIDVAAAGAVRLSGSTGYLQVAGQVHAEEGSIVARRTRSANRGADRPPAANTVALDLTMSAGSKIELLWPVAELPVIRVFPVPDSTVTLQTDGQGAALPVGEIAFRGGEIFYFERNFLIREGSLRMNVINQRFDPLISMRAELREYVNRGPVSIFLIIEDDFLSQLSPRLEAIPPLSQVEIVNILGGNITQVAATTNPLRPVDSARIALDLAGDVLSRVAILSNFESSLRDVLGVFDILTIRTQVLQNVIYDIINTANTSSSQSVARYFNNTDLFLGAHLADNLFFQWELGLRVDEENEYYGGALGELQLNTAFSIELQSPLGVLKWSVEPELRNAFRINGSVGLSWSVGY